MFLDDPAVLAFRATAKYFLAISGMAGTGKINTELFKYGINGVKFAEVLRQSGAVMAGEFPLQCIMGEEWIDSPILLFVNDKSDLSPLRSFINARQCVPSGKFPNLIRKFIQNMTRKEQKNFRRFYEPWNKEAWKSLLYIAQERAYVDASSTRAIIKKSTNNLEKWLFHYNVLEPGLKGFYIEDCSEDALIDPNLYPGLPCKKLEYYFLRSEHRKIGMYIVHTGSRDCKTFIHEMFDFSFCKIVYDGRTVRTPSELFKKECRLDSRFKYTLDRPARPDDYARSIEFINQEIEKFEARGFKIWRPAKKSNTP